MLAFFPPQLPVPLFSQLEEVEERVQDQLLPLKPYLLSYIRVVRMYLHPSAVNPSSSCASLGAVLGYTDTSNIIVGVYLRVWAICE